MVVMVNTSLWFWHIDFLMWLIVNFEHENILYVIDATFMIIQPGTVKHNSTPIALHLLAASKLYFIYNLILLMH